MRELQWFILRVKSTRERSVIRSLSERGIRSAFIGERHKDERGNATDDDCRVDVPGYVFIEMERIGDALHWQKLANLPEVYNLVGQFAGLNVARVPAWFMEKRLKHVRLKEGGSEYVIFLKRDEKSTVMQRIKFLKGETVRVKSGPATGICGTVQEDTEAAVCIDFGNYALNVDQTLVERVESAA